MRVLVCIPARDEVKTEFLMSLVAMMQHCAFYPKHDLQGIGFHCVRTSVLPSGRQALADEVLRTGVTHSLWLDTDMAFPKDTLYRLVEADKDFIGVNVRCRRPPFLFLTESDPTTRLITNKDSTGIVKVHRTGFGVVLIKTEVFRKLSLPFFDFEWQGQKKGWRGEDYYFCEKARKEGVEFWIDHDLSKKIGHIGDFAYMP